MTPTEKRLVLHVALLTSYVLARDGHHAPTDERTHEVSMHIIASMLETFNEKWHGEMGQDISDAIDAAVKSVASGATFWREEE